MKIIDPDLLAEFASATECACCGRKTPFGCDPAHVFSRGAGQIDHRWNLISLARECHTAHHAGGKPTRAELLELVAKREQTSPEAITELVQRLRRMPKEASLCEACQGTGRAKWVEHTPIKVIKVDDRPFIFMGKCVCDGNGAVINGEPIPAHLIRETV